MRQLLYVPRSFFLALLFSLPLFAAAQEPDVSAITTYDGKMKAWLDYCEALRLNSSGAKNNYVVLQQAGSKGLQLAKANDPENRSKLFFYIALGQYYQLRFDSAQYYFYQSLNEARRGHVVKQITKACVALIPVNFQLQQQDKVDECKNILQSIADTTHNQSLLEDAYYALGSYYQQKSFYSTAQDYFIKSIELREKEVDTTHDLKKKFDYAIQCDMLSKLYLNTEMVDKSIDALRKGERFASVSPNVGNRLLSSFVEAYTTSGNIDSALYYNNQLDQQTRNSGMFSSEIVSSDLNVAIYYIDHRQYAKALPYVTKGDTLAARIQSPLLIFQAQMVRGRWLEETGNYDQAISLLLQSLPVAKQFSRELYANTLKYMAVAQKGKGNSDAAVQYYAEYVQALDTLTKEKLSRTFADLETHYQANEKEQRILSLDKENRMRVLELQNASREQLLLILGLAALGIISLLLYFIYRNKEKLNKVLNERNDRLDELNRHLAEANETKARLFGIIGHDLRAPVSKIVQLLKLQKERPDLLQEAAAGQHEERLKKASENVLETMEDLLIWSKSQMQSFAPQFSPVIITELLKKEIGLLEDQLEDERLHIDCRVPASFVQNTDENFLTVIVRNLLQNAVKYSGKGTTIIISSDTQNLFIANSAPGTAAPSLNQNLADSRVSSKSSGLGLRIAADLAVKIHTRLFFRQEGASTLQAVLSWEPAPL